MAGVQRVTVLRGHIWLVALDPTVANEQRGTRPCIVVSGDRFNALPIRLAIVVPLTSRHRGLPHHISVADDGGLERPSWAMCEAVRAVSIQRFGRIIGTATDETLRAITDQLLLWLAPEASGRR
jgi:mRNA interferase MazF